jgi:hypothetical protein
MNTVTSLSAIGLDSSVTFASAGELDNYIQLMVVGGHDRATVLDLFANFIWSVDGESAWLNTSTWSINHADDEGLNIEVYVDETGAIVAKSLTVIAEGDELRMNYRNFNQPKFYLDYCTSQKMVDVRSMVIAAVDGPMRVSPTESGS